MYNVSTCGGEGVDPGAGASSSFFKGMGMAA